MQVVKHNSTRVRSVCSTAICNACNHAITASSRKPRSTNRFTNDVEQTLLDWHRRFNLKASRTIRHQMSSRNQLPAVLPSPAHDRFSSDHVHLDGVAQNLLALISGRRLQIYPDDQIRTACCMPSLLKADAAGGSTRANKAITSTSSLPWAWLSSLQSASGQSTV